MSREANPGNYERIDNGSYATEGHNPGRKQARLQCLYSAIDKGRCFSSQVFPRKKKKKKEREKNPQNLRQSKQASMRIDIADHRFNMAGVRKEIRNSLFPWQQKRFNERLEDNRKNQERDSCTENCRTEERP